MRNLKHSGRSGRLVVVVVALLLLAVGVVWAKGPAGVAKGLHNLSGTGVDAITGATSFYATDEDEICVFCHTPHGGSLTGPLWNRSNPRTATFTHYNSATLSTYLKGLSASRTVGNESLLCLSCHDGSVGTAEIHNLPNDRNGAPIAFAFGGSTGMATAIVDIFGVPASRIGATLNNLTGTGDLSDDHPISFSYDSVLTSAEYTTGSKVGELRTLATATGWKGEGVRFFGSDHRVECSSCHDPHVNYNTFSGGNLAYRGFLIRPNTGSDLCLSCHNK